MASKLKQNVLCYGVTRVEGRGIPKCVKQQEETTKIGIAQHRGTLKVAVLKGDPSMPSLIAASLYDVKPFYFLSNQCEKLQWIKMTRKVWHRGQNKKVDLDYFRLNIIDEYNNNMNNVDVADQLRVVYRFDRWMRKRKWWWSIFFWSFELLLTNAYVLYKKYHTMHKSKPMSHFEFQRAIAMAWISPTEYWPPSGPKSKEAQVPSTMSQSSWSTRSQAQPKVLFKRGTAFTDKTLHPTGALSCRLHGNFHHWPIENTKKYAHCQLHYWATRKRMKRNILHCSHCNVKLCIKCFTQFHTISDIVALKKNFQIKYAADEEDE